MAAVCPLYESEECCTRALPSPGGDLILPGLLPVEGAGPLVCEEGLFLECGVQGGRSVK